MAHDDGTTWGEVKPSFQPCFLGYLPSSLAWSRPTEECFSLFSELATWWSLSLMPCWLGRISNFLDSHCRKRWSGLFWKALVLLQAVTKDFSSAVITTLISPDLLTPHPPPQCRADTAKEEHTKLMMIFLHILRKIRRRRNFHTGWCGGGGRQKMTTGQFEVWCSKCDH